MALAQTYLARSRRGDMQALAVRGIFVTDCYPQLNSIISRALGASLRRPAGRAPA